MLTPKKKITKKEMKEDALVSSYVKATTFYYENKQMILMGVTAVVVIIAGILLYGKYRTDNNNNAALNLGDIYPLYDAGEYQHAIDGIPERNIKGLKAIVEEFGNSDAGEVARFYLANAYYQLGRFDDALDQFKRYSPASQVLEISRLSGLAACYEAKGNYKEAASDYEKAANKDLKAVSAAENLFCAARNYAKSGDTTTALAMYKKVKSEYSTSSFGREADRAIGGLTALQ
jgi:TolA-binding protein